jgi:hypothetical protein
VVAPRLHALIEAYGNDSSFGGDVMTGKIPLLCLCSAEISPLFAAFISAVRWRRGFALQAFDFRGYSESEIGLF